MTDVTPEATSDTENWDAPERDGEAYPEYPANPHNHRFTVSYDPQKPPFVVVRANTAEELKAAFDELESSGAGASMGNAWRVLKAQASVGAGLGPTTPVPDAQAAPAAPSGFPVAPPQGQFNQQPAQQFPGQAGQAPAAWQNAGAPAQAVQDNLPEYRQHGWMACNIPYKPGNGNPGKPGFDALVAQYGMRKGRPSEGGQVSYNKANKTWYITPEAAPSFGQFSPVPA
ncbi:hypothetical protein AS594_07235 [Streptomyces agglomeratus]|uniref:Uncharacterized protein n=1 Tax=Streptomyces agglomeratus TaxID=285458 RepID=A0A1E5P447_9ACTN|nr:hypothetical protein [Streptomyces agglomeratus]OEJ24316.1 hypothetical protein AS594_07235 [Streptomyces agglomeratus]